MKQLFETLERFRAWLLPIALALLGVLFLYISVHQYRVRLGYGMELRKVLIVVKHLPEGHQFSSSDFGYMEIPAKFLPLGVLLDSDLENAIGRKLVRPMAEGEMVLWPSLDTNVGPAGPARRIAVGHRAIAMNIDSSISVGHFVRPGDHLDIAITANAEDGGIRTFTLLQNIPVLDIDSSTLTLMAMPKEIALIVHARQQGRITFSLRNPDDHATPNDLPIVTNEQLIESSFRNSIQQERNESIQIIRSLP